MRAQRIYRVIAPREFRFAQGRMYLLVAQIMEKDRLAALSAPQFRDKVVPALRYTLGNLPAAQRADWQRIVMPACLGG